MPALYGKRLWKQPMRATSSQFKRPSNIVSMAVDYKSGLLPSELTPQEFIVTELFHKDFCLKKLLMFGGSTNLSHDRSIIY